MPPLSSKNRSSTTRFCVGTVPSTLAAFGKIFGNLHRGLGRQSEIVLQHRDIAALLAHVADLGR